MRKLSKGSGHLVCTYMLELQSYLQFVGSKCVWWFQSLNQFLCANRKYFILRLLQLAKLIFYIFKKPWHKKCLKELSASIQLVGKSVKITKPFHTCRERVLTFQLHVLNLHCTDMTNEKLF